MAISERLRLIIESTADTSGFKKTENAFDQTDAQAKEFLDTLGKMNRRGESVADTQRRLAGDIDRTTKETNELTTANQKNIQSFKRVNLSLTDVIMGFQALSRMAQQAGEALAIAGQQEGIRIEFRRMAEQAGLSANEVLASMEAVAQGTISAQRQMQAANKLFLANMDLTADQIGQLMAIARDRARGMGISVEKAFADIIQGVTKSQPLILDNLGIIVKMGEASKIMADALGKSVDDLTAQERSMALVNQVLRDNGDAMDRVLDRQDSMGESLARVTTSAENITVAMGAWATQSQFVEAALTGINFALDRFGQAAQFALAEIDAQVEFSRVLRETGDEQLALIAMEAARLVSLRNMKEALGEVFEGTDTLNAKLNQLALAFATHEVGFTEFESQWKSLTAQITDPAAVQAIENLLNTADDFGSADFVRNLGIILNSFDDIGESAEELEDDIESLSDQFLESKDAVREFASAIRDARLEQSEGLARLVDDARDSNRRIAGFDDDLQRQLEKTTLQGTQRRADIGIRFGDKQEDIALKRGDNITDLDREIAGARISVHREFWQEIQRINAQGEENETDAIRARDARALTEARNQEQKEVNSATQAHENEERALEESNRNKEREIETATQRALRDAGIARSRQLRDQQTGELRSIQSQRTASEIRISNERQAQAIAESDLIAHWDRRVAITEEGARREFQAAIRPATTTGPVSSTGAFRQRPTSDGRSRTRVR